MSIHADRCARCLTQHDRSQRLPEEGEDGVPLRLHPPSTAEVDELQAVGEGQEVGEVEALGGAGQDLGRKQMVLLW